MLNITGLLTDDELTKLLRQGDESAFTYIYNNYWNKLYYIAYKLLKNTNEAEEIVQDVFTTFWSKRESLNIQSIDPYLGAMTRYAVYRSLAKEKQYKFTESDTALMNVAAASGIDVDNKILLEIITELSNQLPEKCRLVFQYNKLQDQSLADVAAQLNISQKTAEAHLTKALRFIKSEMGGTARDYTQIIIILALLRK